MQNVVMEMGKKMKLEIQVRRAYLVIWQDIQNNFSVGVAGDQVFAIRAVSCIRNWSQVLQFQFETQVAAV